MLGMLNDVAIACSCYGLRDSEIAEVIRDGAGSVDEVTEVCGAGGSCGSCRPTIEAFLTVQGVRIPVAVG